MDWLELGPKPPPALLAWEEAFLDDLETGGPERLWVWESTQHFVVVGFGQSIDREVHTAFCQARNISVLRRCSGGGAVLQGPGCLSYGLTLRLEQHPELGTVTSANRWIMDRNASALNRLHGIQAVVRGHSDLAIIHPEGPERKVSGNAQRRTRHGVLFHGTFLCHADLDTVSQSLRPPSVQPEYRSNRAHADFLTNLEVSTAEVQDALRQEWAASPSDSRLPEDRYRELLTRKYQTAEWHQHRKSRVAPP